MTAFGVIIYVMITGTIWDMSALIFAACLLPPGWLWTLSCFCGSGILENHVECWNCDTVNKVSWSVSMEEVKDARWVPKVEGQVCSNCGSRLNPFGHHGAEAMVGRIGYPAEAAGAGIPEGRRCGIWAF